ncbi:coiled-coil domain-containing protein 103 isoform X2 [Engraulis encrasicolus]|uniref:coiled-coil domain-containing protein 103 isoform X2 n=1 Tax=Engraulis encrasicolus TaxID=184585 RepID=UPI002FD04996
MESEFEIDFSALERELKSAVEADQKYSRENDAKFRALHQKVATYEEFRKDKAGAPRNQPWNTVASSEKCQGLHLEGMQAQPSDFHPRTASEFSRDWRRLGSEGAEKKYQLLLGLGGQTLQDIFRTEVGFGLLGELLLTLSQGFRPVDLSEVVGVLDGLSKTPRFGLNVSLLSKGEMGACKELFQKIQRGVDVDPLPSDGSRGVEAAASSPGGAAVVVEAQEECGSCSIREKVKHLMQIYGVSNSNT